METIIISVIATIISLISLIFCATSFIKQYGKSLYAQIDYRVAFFKNGNMYRSFLINIVNTSQFPIYIKEIGIYAYSEEIKDFEYIWLGCIEPDYEENLIKILPQENKEFYFDVNGVIELISGNIDNGIASKKVKIAIKDSTNKLYIKKDVTNELMRKLLKRG